MSGVFMTKEFWLHNHDKFGWEVHTSEPQLYHHHVFEISEDNIIYNIRSLETKVDWQRNTIEDLQEDLGFWKKEAALHGDAREQSNDVIEYKNNLIENIEDITLNALGLCDTKLGYEIRMKESLYFFMSARIVY